MEILLWTIIIGAIITLIFTEKGEKRKRNELDNIPLEQKLFQIEMNRTNRSGYLDRIIREDELSRKLNHY